MFKLISSIFKRGGERKPPAVFPDALREEPGFAQPVEAPPAKAEAAATPPATPAPVDPKLLQASLVEALDFSELVPPKNKPLATGAARPVSSAAAPRPVAVSEVATLAAASAAIPAPAPVAQPEPSAAPASQPKPELEAGEAAAVSPPETIPEPVPAAIPAPVPDSIPPVAAVEPPQQSKPVAAPPLMTLAEDVVAAYKLFLGRLPENLDVVQLRVGHPAERTLFEFMVAPEFLQKEDNAKRVLALAKQVLLEQQDQLAGETEK